LFSPLCEYLFIYYYIEKLDFSIFSTTRFWQFEYISMYIRKKMALSTSQKILQEEAAVQKNTYSNVAAKLPEGLRSE